MFHVQVLFRTDRDTDKETADPDAETGFRQRRCDHLIIAIDRGWLLAVRAVRG
jgi:hypothetical protein